uniref:uncharacterized protein LOC120325667 isoform X2 n=1 Tax=Styela clava TaxID=7725 RepID=UPI00193A7939|nr:uncharacterized protein LOC120325667 isoform X2 [Styela clava]
MDRQQSIHESNDRGHPMEEGEPAQDQIRPDSTSARPVWTGRDGSLEEKEEENSDNDEITRTDKSDREIIYLKRGRMVGQEFYQEFRNWFKTHESNQFGKFVQKTNDLWVTENKPVINYKWPTTDSGTTENIALLTSYVMYDHLNSKIIFPLADSTNCSVNQSSCQIVCNELTTDCFGSIFCLENELLVQVKNCSLLKKVNVLREFADHADISTALTLMIQNVADSQTALSAKLQSQIFKLECETERILSKIYRVLAKTYPSDVLNEILGTNNLFAVNRGDVLGTLLCQPIKASLLNSLILPNELYSTRPLVNYTDNTNTTVIAQYLSSGRILPGINFYSTEPQEFVTFKMNNTYYSYQKGILQNKTTNPKKIHPYLTTPWRSQKPNPHRPIIHSSSYGTGAKSSPSKREGQCYATPQKQWWKCRGLKSRVG